MRKIIPLALVYLSALSPSLSSASEPLILPEFYAFKISQDGKWLYSNTGSGEIIIYNLETNQHNEFYEMTLGNGNAIANNGICVGSTDMGEAVFLKDDEEIYPNAFAQYWYSSPAGITADGSHVVGVVGNNGTSDLDDEVQYYLPFIAEIDSEGNVTHMEFLPHPDKDFFGVVPQYCSASWVSNDGKVVLGQIIGGTGSFIQPIIYRQGEDSSWSYSLPSKPMFNPENLPIPEYPGEFTMTPPDPVNFINDEEKRMEYLEDMDWWMNEGGFSDDYYPGNHLDEYMTLEEIDAYNEAVDEFNDAAEEYNKKIEAFFSVRDEILDTSVTFLRNGFCMNSDGTIGALASEYYIGDEEIEIGSGYTTYILDISNDSMKEIKNQNPYIYPTQVLDGGIILGSTGGAEVQATYVYLPGASDYIPVEDYFANTNPTASTWLRENLVQPLFDESMAMISGCGVASDDFSVFASGVTAYMFPDSDNVFFTYVFNGLEAGVERVNIKDDSVIKIQNNGVLSISENVSNLSITDLSGRKVFTLPNAYGSIDTNLNHGIYIVEYTDCHGQRISLKAYF